MGFRTRWLAHALLLQVAGLALAQDGAPPAGEEPAEPLDLGIEEYTERRLAQIDVAVSGPPEVIGNLGPSDFELFVGNLVLGGEAFQPIFADRRCPAAHPVAGGSAQPEDGTAAAAKSAAPAAQRVHYVFFFDQPHITFVGRQRAMQVARDLTRSLIGDGSRASVISTSRRLETYAQNTDDREELLRAINKLEDDPEQVESFGENFEDRLRQVARWRNSNRDYPGARNFAESLAFQFQKEEITWAARSLSRLATVVRSMAELESPKVLFYFADTMISRPGQHYYSIFSTNLRSLDTGPVDPWAAVAPFEQVIQDAAAANVRLYPIQAEGLVQGRYRESAQHSLGGFAKETGGKHFINGVPAEKIAKRVEKELSCIYVLSFDPAGLTEDERHGLQVEIRHPQVKLTAHSAFVLRSPEQKRQAELEAAFVTPELFDEQESLASVLIPTGFEDGKYSALLQVSVPPSPIRDAEWELGVSVLWRDAVRQDADCAITVNGGATPVVFELPVELSLAEFELVMVAREANADLLVTGYLTDRWPDPRKGRVSFGPVAAAQSETAFFVRGKETKQEGALGIREAMPLRVDRRTTILTLVCRDPKNKAEILLVDRELKGTLGVVLAPLELELPEGIRCGLVKDGIPRGQLRPGTFSYTIMARDAEGRSANATRAFAVVSGGGKDRAASN